MREFSPDLPTLFARMFYSFIHVNTVIVKINSVHVCGGGSYISRSEWGFFFFLSSFFVFVGNLTKKKECKDFGEKLSQVHRLVLYYG